MGLFGNKDNKGNKQANLVKQGSATEQKPIEANTNQLAKVQTYRSNNFFEQWTSKTCGMYQAWKKQSCQWLDSPQIKEIKHWRKQFVGDFCRPVAKFYRSFPQDLTSFKYKTFGQFSLKERFFGLEGLTLLVAIFTFNRRKVQSGVIGRLLYSTRNAALAYLLGGLFIAPEIYNPLIRSDF